MVVGPGRSVSIDDRAEGVTYRARLALAGLARDAVLDLRRSISQRRAGPGGVSVRNTADIAMTRLASGTSSRFIFIKDPLAKSVAITSIGMAPQPRPARKKACFAPRSASRHVFAEKTPKSLPCDSSERSVRTSCLCCGKDRRGNRASYRRQRIRRRRYKKHLHA